MSTLLYVRSIPRRRHCTGRHRHGPIAGRTPSLVTLSQLSAPEPRRTACPSVPRLWAGHGARMSFSPSLPSWRAHLAAGMRDEMRSQLSAARFRTDELFRLLRPQALYERPIPERHRIVFYLGHLEAFDWNLICAGLFQMESPQKEFGRLFAFGIDPTDGQLPQDRPGDWPQEKEIRRYNTRV